MYALIYDEHDLSKPWKQVISVHKTRRVAENALEKRRKGLDRTIEECFTRIVWVEGRVRKGDQVSTSDFSTWRPGEVIPEGELYSDSD